MSFVVIARDWACENFESDVFKRKITLLFFFEKTKFISFFWKREFPFFFKQEETKYIIR